MLQDIFAVKRCNSKSDDSIPMREELLRDQPSQPVPSVRSYPWMEALPSRDSVLVRNEKGNGEVQSAVPQGSQFQITLYLCKFKQNMNSDCLLWGATV